MEYNIKMIKSKYSKGIKLEYVFFDSINPVQAVKGESENTSVRKNCLGKYYDCIFRIDRQRFFSLVGYMSFIRAKTSIQPEKYQPASCALMLGDLLKSKRKIIKKIRASKKLWNEKMFEVAMKGNIEKFSQNPELKEYLLSTGDKILVDLDSKDDVWGIGNTRGNIENPFNWKGKNLLGFCLMQVRDILREQNNND